MLVETQIRFAVPGLGPEELDDVVAHACRAMSEARRELHEHVSFQEVIGVKGDCIKFCIRGLRSHAEKEYMYDRRTREMFPYNATYSHMDLESIHFLRTMTKLEMDPGF